MKRTYFYELYKYKILFYFLNTHKQIYSIYVYYLVFK